MSTTRSTYPNPAIEALLAGLDREEAAHGLELRCPTCNVGAGRWCIGTERLAGPTDRRPSHPARLVAATKAAAR